MSGIHKGEGPLAKRPFWMNAMANKLYRKRFKSFDREGVLP